MFSDAVWNHYALVLLLTGVQVWLSRWQLALRFFHGMFDRCPLLMFTAASCFFPDHSLAPALSKVPEFFAKWVFHYADQRVYVYQCAVMDFFTEVGILFQSLIFSCVVREGEKKNSNKIKLVFHAKHRHIFTVMMPDTWMKTVLSRKPFPMVKQNKTLVEQVVPLT